MFGLGVGEVLLICALGLIFVGPKKIPALARSLGKGLREFQRAKEEMVDEFYQTENPLTENPLKGPKNLENNLKNKDKR